MSKKAEKYNTFGKRLLAVANARQMGDTGILANVIYSNKRCREIVKIRKHKEHTNPYEEVEAIRRNIQNHLTQDKYYEAWKVPSQYMYAYSIILDCSLDYLYGTSEIMSSDLEVADICQKTGLSEDAVNCLVENMSEDDADPDEENVFSYTSWWSNLLCGDSYYAIPISWFSYASRIVEMNDITKQIRGSDRAEKEVDISDVYTSLLFNEDGKHKSLQIKKRNLEDSFLGAQHRMLSCMEHFLLDYAEEWAEKQHTDYEEKFYKKALKIREVLKEENKK